MSSHAPSEHGFTLLEVLVAITITSIIGIALWQTLHSTLNTRDHVDRVSKEFLQLQRTMTVMERDFLQIVHRPTRDRYGELTPALTGEHPSFDILLTRQGWRNPLGSRRSNLQRVGWALVGSQLTRTDWVTLDQGQEDNAAEVIQLDNVRSLQVDWLVDEQWQNQWPQHKSQQGTENLQHHYGALPRAVRIVIEHERFGKIDRIFAMPDTLPIQAFKNASLPDDRKGMAEKAKTGS